MIARIWKRCGFTMVELLVVLGVISVLMALMIPAVQRVREFAARAQCTNNLRQIGLGLHQYHDAQHAFPPGISLRFPDASSRFLSWQARLLPFVDQTPLWMQTQGAFEKSSWAFANPPHVGLSTVLPLYCCPSDDRTRMPQRSKRTNANVALTSYLGVSGLDLLSKDGILFPDSRVRVNDIMDGTSQTLIAGERPPSPDFQFGWWYAGIGQIGSGSCDSVLGAAEINVLNPWKMPCPKRGYRFGPGDVSDPCSMFHYWSLHTSGAHFAFADGSTRFVSYASASVITKLATRSGQDSGAVE